MILHPNNLSPKDRYKLITGSIVPRPIAWVSSINKKGDLNLAPFSYFNAVCTDPLTLMFCPSVHPWGDKKDTWRNIEEVPEFVINLPNEDTAEAMNRSATILPYGQSEFEWANVTPIPSQTITVPRVAEAPIAFECQLQQIVTISEQPFGGAIILGQVQCVHIRDDIYDNGYISLDRYKPIGRLAGNNYTKTTDTFQMKRLPASNIS